MQRWLWLCLVVGVAALVGWRAALPPPPLPADAPRQDFSAGRAMADVRQVGSRPHPVGSAENAAVRGRLTARLRALGFGVREHRVFLPPAAARRLAAWGDPDARYRQAVSLIATRPGRVPTAAAIGLMAHHDSVWGSPGAADDAAGVAAALEIARAIPVASQARDLVIILTDGEEVGLVGARAIFGAAQNRDKGSTAAPAAPAAPADPIAARLGVLINLEARGAGGRAFMFETGPDAGDLMRLYARVVPDPATTSLAVKVYERLPNSTDFTPARRRGLAGLNFAFTGRAGLYHSPLSTPEALDPASLQHMGTQALAVTRALVTAPTLPAPAPDAAFGDVLGRFTIVYAPAWGWALIAVIAVAAVAALRRNRDWRTARIAGAMLDALVVTAAVAAFAFAGNLLSGADGPTNYYDRLAALPRLELMALLAMLAGLAVTLAMTPRQRSLWDGWTGFILVNLLALIAVQLWLPIGAPVLAWPLLPAALALAVASRNRFAGLALAGAAAVFGLAMVGGFAHNLLLGVGIATPGAVAVFAPLLLALLWPLVPDRPARRPLWLFAGACLAVQAGLALWVRLDPMAPGIAVYNPKT